jgi:hypothetical protein
MLGAARSSQRTRWRRRFLRISGTPLRGTPPIPVPTQRPSQSKDSTAGRAALWLGSMYHAPPVECVYAAAACAAASLCADEASVCSDSRRALRLSSSRHRRVCRSAAQDAAKHGKGQHSSQTPCADTRGLQSTPPVDAKARKLGRPVLPRAGCPGMPALPPTQPRGSR